MLGPVSTWMGHRLGTRGVVCIFCLFHLILPLLCSLGGKRKRKPQYKGLGGWIFLPTFQLKRLSARLASENWFELGAGHQLYKRECRPISFFPPSGRGKMWTRLPPFCCHLMRRAVKRNREKAKKKKQACCERGKANLPWQSLVRRHVTSDFCPHVSLYLLNTWVTLSYLPAGNYECNLQSDIGAGEISLASLDARKEYVGLFLPSCKYRLAPPQWQLLKWQAIATVTFLEVPNGLSYRKYAWLF